MTDEEKLKAVTAKLTGKFYVGQRVQLKQRSSAIRGIVVGFDLDGDPVVQWNPDVGLPTPAAYRSESIEPS